MADKVIKNYGQLDHNNYQAKNFAIEIVLNVPSVITPGRIVKVINQGYKEYVCDPSGWRPLVTATGGFVDLTTNQTIGGVKTFSSSPIVPTPTTSTQAANKTYVDSKATVSAPKVKHIVGTTNIEINETTWTNMPDMTYTKNYASSTTIFILFVAPVAIQTVGYYQGFCQLTINGTEVNKTRIYSYDSNGCTAAISHIATVNGTQTILVRWKTGTKGAKFMQNAPEWGNRTLTIIEGLVSI